MTYLADDPISCYRVAVSCLFLPCEFTNQVVFGPSVDTFKVYPPPFKVYPPFFKGGSASSEYELWVGVSWGCIFRPPQAAGKILRF